MRVTIIADDGKVGVDGVFRAVDLSALDPNIHAVQWDGVTGHIEFKDRSPEQQITAISAFRSFIDDWTAAAPPPPTLAKLKDAKFSDFQNETVVRMAVHVPAWDTFKEIQFLLSFDNLLNLSNSTSAQDSAIAVLKFTRDTVKAKLAAVTTQTELDAIDPTAADPFGDGTPWPSP